MDRIKGLFFGLSIGDCLGATPEGDEPQIPVEFQSDIPSKIEGSDVTALGLCLLKSLIECRGLNVDNLGKKFVEFFDSGPSSLGNTESSAFYSMKIGLDPRECGVSSGGNGSLLRCSPLAIFYSAKALKEVSYLQTSLTHSSEFCKACDFLFLMALHMALEGLEKGLIYDRVLEEAKKLNLKVYDALNKLPDLTWEQLETSSFVVDTFSSAFWGLLNTDSFEAALVSIASKGDDSRACSALTGALCGAYYGADSIPARWLNNMDHKEEFENLLSQVK
ncbi:MAG: hypothetical protein E2O68_04065 [Deltaproteobacteria bacterium]|nr:MAG: hypothetical protein E2O68_04065 [Deltaproteobacteria bacterium]